MVDMDTSTPDAKLDAPRWHVTVETATKTYHFNGVLEDQKDELENLRNGYDYEWTDDKGNEDFIWAKPVERVVFKVAMTLREEREYQRMRMQEIRNRSQWG